MRKTAKIACLAVVALVAGCSTLSDAIFDPPKHPPAKLVEFKPAMSVRTAWSVNIGKAGVFSFSPAYTGDALFAASADGTLVRLDPATGHEVWRVSAGAPLSAGVGSDGNTVAVVADKGVLMAFDGNGKLRWKAQASTEVLSAPAVGQGLVVIRSVDNRIAAYDATSGERRWIVQRTLPPLTLRNAPGIAIAGPTAYVAMPGGHLLALALSNGAPVWEAVVAEPRGATELERVTDTSGTPVVMGRQVCAVAFQGRVACFDPANGTPRWTKPLSSDVGIAMDERYLFAADDQGAVNAFQAENGTSVWRNDKLANRQLSTPVSFERSVAVGDLEGYVHFLSREDGAFLARVATDGSPVIGNPAIAGSIVVFQTQAGSVVGLTTAGQSH